MEEDALSPLHLLSLGMFVFGMDTMPYHELEQNIVWRHEGRDRFGARQASQYLGPGEDVISISGRMMPEIAGSYSSIGAITEMADTGGNWPLMDGTGAIWGNYRIDHLRLAHIDVMGGGVPRGMDFTLDLTRVS